MISVKQKNLVLKIALAGWLAGLLALAGVAQDLIPPLAEKEFPSVEELPDPFRFADGRRVRTPADWRQRREEIQAVLLRYEYGQVPSPPAAVRLDKVLASEIRNDGLTRFQAVRLKPAPEPDFTFRADLYFPRRAAGRRPVILRIGPGCPIVKTVNERGYLLACLNHQDLDPETEGHEVRGPAQAAYPDHDWGSVAVWAWGASRLLDYLLTLPEVDPERIIVTGHSRTGKAALLAGALDERFAVVVPNGSGCGGASCYRIATPGVETLELITRPSRFQSWFQPQFRRFAGREDRLPFDQHWLRALVAPRPLLTTDALEDRWANPRGNQAGFLAAQRVYEFLDAGDRHGLHFRPGKHDQLAADFLTLMDFAEAWFAGRPRAADFTVLPDPDFRLNVSWSVP